MRARVRACVRVCVQRLETMIMMDRKSIDKCLNGEIFSRLRKAPIRYPNHL